MTPIKFAPEREKRVTTLGEAINALKTDFAFTPQQCLLQNLTVDESYHLHLNGTELVPTQWAFRNFLGRLRIPYTFGTRIPNDLLETVVARLKDMLNTPVSLVVRDGTLVNVVPANYWAPGLSRVLELFGSRPADSIVLTDKGIRFMSTSKVQVEPEAGDSFKLGIILRGSETGGPAPYAVLETHRLVCRNDAIVHPEWGAAKWDKRIRNDGFDIFAMAIQRLLDNSEALVPALHTLPKRTLPVNEFRHLWLQTSRIFGGPGTDMLFGVNEEQRKEFSNAAKARLEVDTGLNAYKVFNELTLRARDLKSEPGERLMTIAGSMLGRKN